MEAAGERAIWVFMFADMTFHAQPARSLIRPVRPIRLHFHSTLRQAILEKMALLKLNLDEANKRRNRRGTEQPERQQITK